MAEDVRLAAGTGWVLCSDAVAAVLQDFFRSGELISYTLGSCRAGDEDARGSLCLTIETTAGDDQEFYVWQPEIESLHTEQGVQASLAEQLESWFPSSRTGWGSERRSRFSRA